MRVLDYGKVRLVKPLAQQENDEGLVTMHVDSLVIGVGWMLPQRFDGIEYPIVFGLITFNKVEA